MSEFGTREMSRVARLSRLQLTDEELASITPQIARVLEHVSLLNALDTTGVAPTAQVLDAGIPLREDVAVPWFTVEDVLSNAGESDDGFVIVPKIIQGSH